MLSLGGISHAAPPSQHPPSAPSTRGGPRGRGPPHRHWRLLSHTWRSEGMMQMKRLTPALLFGLLLALGRGMAAAAPAAAIPTETGCPSGYQVLVVDELLAHGYRAPAIVDAEGN